MSDFGSGLKKPCIITLLPRSEESLSLFGLSTREYEYDRLLVWADKGHDFSRIEGVFKVDVSDDKPVYIVHIDPRFDTQWVMAEVEGITMTQNPKEQFKYVGKANRMWIDDPFKRSGT